MELRDELIALAADDLRLREELEVVRGARRP